MLNNGFKLFSWKKEFDYWAVGYFLRHLWSLRNVSVRTNALHTLTSTVRLNEYVSSCYSPLGPNNLLSAPFSNALCQCSSLRMRSQFSLPYETTGKIWFVDECWGTKAFVTVFYTGVELVQKSELILWAVRGAACSFLRRPLGQYNVHLRAPRSSFVIH
jgi:hypothetical protein